MSVIELPDQLASLVPMPVTVSAVSAALCCVRAAGTTTSDAWTATSRRGVPGDFSGVTAESAGYAFTQFGKDADATTAALERGSLALDVYAEQVQQQTTAHGILDEDRTTFNWRVIGLEGRIETAGEGADVAALSSEAKGLFELRTTLEQRSTAFWEGVTAAERRLATALAAVDTDEEARTAAAAPGRPDVPALLRALAALGNDAVAINAWWRGLTPAQQEALRIHSPELVGNTDGIPTDDRDEANRSQLEKDDDYLAAKQAAGETLTEAEKKRLANVQAVLKGLEAGERTLDPHTGLPVDTHLIVYQPLAFGGDGAAAISYGDPDTADNTAVVVPGLSNDGSTIASQGEDALNLLRAAGGEQSTAVIAWMGYDAPSGGAMPGIDVDANPVGGVGVSVTIPRAWGVGGEGLATDGGHLLSSFVDGLRATHEGDPTHLSVIAHSYGSTTAAHAASDDGLDVDSLTLLGSPGAGDDAHDVGDLHLPAGSVYVGSAENDPVTWLGGETDVGLGHDPSQQDFGATRIGVDDGQRHHVDDFGAMFDNHTSYFDPAADQQSVDNLGAIIRGDEPTEVAGRTDSARSHLTDYAEGEAGYWADQGLDLLEDAGRSVYDDTLGRLPFL